MFCPKCGKDCGEFEFCPQCGTEVPKAEPAVWSVGMACPHCGGTELNGNNCAFCGALLKEDVPAEKVEEDSYDIPYGMYQHGFSNDWVHLIEGALLLRINRYYKKGYGNIRVPFEDLVEVVYERSEKDSQGRFGAISYLRVFWRAKGKPIFPAIRDRTLNYYSFYFSMEHEGERFFHLCAILKQLVPPSVKITTRVVKRDKKCTQVLPVEIDWDAYFSKFNPYRLRAVEALWREYSISARVARPMVDDVFEMRQWQLYEEQPSLAIRDMNRVLAEKKRYEDEREREREERHAQRERNRT